MKADTITRIEKDQKSSLALAKKCILNNISFEFMNNVEFYFFIYDEEDFLRKQEILGEDVINLAGFNN